MKTNKALISRYSNTIDFLTENVGVGQRILDLGIENELSRLIRERGYNIENTRGEDLDLEQDINSQYGEYDVISAFEILEHLVSPFGLLKNLPSKRLIATVPLRLWFSTAYRNKKDPYDWHFHEFEDWQFDWLLDKAGWKVVKRAKWISKSPNIGIRPLLRNITPRYYAVFAVRYSLK